jgi:serine protease
MAVAGVRHIGTKVGFSNLGAEVAISAPGGNCVLIGAGDPCLFSLDTTTDAGSQGPVAAGYTDQFDINVGTSFAAPLVAATAALMRAVNPALAPVQLVQRIKVGAMPFPTTSTTVPAPPQCQSPLVVTEPQVSECLCTTLVCGAGLLDAEAAVRDALRPAALAVFTGLPSPGRSLTLDGSASAASNGRRLVNYAWSVVEVSGGAGQPAFADPGAAITTVLSPSLGSYLLRLTVTDDTGATDTTDITIRAANSGSGGGSTASPPAASGGGGGSTTPLLAWGLALLAVLRWVSHGRLRIKA